MQIIRKSCNSLSCTILLIAYYLVSLSESFHFLKDNYYCISVYYIQLGTNMITLLRLLYISALARIEKLPQKKL